VSRAASERWNEKAWSNWWYVADVQVETRCGRVRSAGLDIRGFRLHDVRA
jgi:hypothetical protein